MSSHKCMIRYFAKSFWTSHKIWQLHASISAFSLYLELIPPTRGHLFPSQTQEAEEKGLGCISKCFLFLSIKKSPDSVWELTLPSWLLMIPACRRETNACDTALWSVYRCWPRVRATHQLSLEASVPGRGVNGSSWTLKQMLQEFSSRHILCYCETGRRTQLWFSSLRIKLYLILVNLKGMLHVFVFCSDFF